MPLLCQLVNPWVNNVDTKEISRKLTVIHASSLSQLRHNGVRLAVGKLAKISRTSSIFSLDIPPAISTSVSSKAGTIRHQFRLTFKTVIINSYVSLNEK